ncbi:hypothetical protein E1264_03360 [Actinomadura sp. KC216]|uniref:hypothetical protein n=1 Tax=Actinomadura sp. KC216 TaxID=2530370 RepID=UPI00104C04A5|nr:hypothetical protein [Actinomadura sp. KC216]TDB90877.1 hypothetical protein E1264_03360 [Actinomadura sp. KC216]
MFETEIKRGAAYLDRVDPEWVKKIDLDLLSINDPKDCVVGQVFGDFWEWMGYYTSWETVHEHGFAAENGDHPQLTKEWKEFIRERQSEQA